MKLLISFFISTLLIVADVAIEPYAKSYHYDRSDGKNEDHRYMALAYRYKNYDLTAMTFINTSYNRTNALTLGYRKYLYETRNNKAGAFFGGGIQEGYKTDVLVVPYGGLFWEHKNVYVRVAMTDKVIVGVVGYIFRMKGGDK